MKHLILICVMAFPFSLLAQSNSTKENQKSVNDTKTNTTKEIKDGEYVMKQYFFVMLSKGARRHEITDTTVLKKIQAGHMDNINRLAGLGKILVAGPFGDDGNWRGIFIFDCPTKEEVEEHLKTDPAIAAGRLSYEIHPWWTAKNAVFK